MLRKVCSVVSYQITQEAGAHWNLENNKCSDILKEDLQFIHKKYTNCKITTIQEYMNNMFPNPNPVSSILYD